MINTTTTKTTPIVCYHIGRGGHFHNAGHLSYIRAYNDKIGNYTDHLFSHYENKSNFKERFGFDSTYGEDQKCILDLINDKDFDELEEKFGITEQMLGEEIYFDGGGNPVDLTVAEEKTGIGQINIDNIYNTTYCKHLEDCSEEELQLIIEDDSLYSDDALQLFNEKYSDN